MLCGLLTSAGRWRQQARLAQEHFSKVNSLPISRLAMQEATATKTLDNLFHDALKDIDRWAEMLGREEAAQLLNETRQEESLTDEELSALADQQVNAEAMRAEA